MYSKEWKRKMAFNQITECFWNQVCVNMMSAFWLRYVPHNLMAPGLTDDDLLLSKLAWCMSEAVKSRACWMRKDVLLKKV